MCNKIPFNELLPNSSPLQRPFSAGHQPLVFGIKVTKILDRQNQCNFCKLLYRSACQPENDLFRSEHISGHFADSEQLKDVKTFEEWSTLSRSKWREKFERSDVWPFGQTHDPEEGKHVREKAEDMFYAAEEKDVNRESTIDNPGAGSENTLDASVALQGVAASLGIAGIAVQDNKVANRILGGGHLVSAQMAIMSARSSNRLPCWFIIRAYRRDEPKAGALSVRVYAHGRALRAPLKEISHFSLRFEGTGEPRRKNQQIWYGNTLGDTIDLSFFGKCLRACKDLHGTPCNKFMWSEPADDKKPNRVEPTPDDNFRLVDVLEQHIVDIPFKMIHAVPYVALSYVWGLPPDWTEHPNIDSKATANDPDFYYHNKVTGTATWNHPITGRSGLTRLCQRNKHLLSHPEALRSRNIPQTIRDAMMVVEKVGQRHLWVDSLCIIQDKSTKEKTADLARMDRIYGHALFTIVAADSPHMDAGIKGIDPSNLRTPPKQILGSDIVPNAQLFLPIAVQQKLHPWELRAWTFQEKLLSRRLLVFAGGFAIWHCRGADWREDVNALDGGGTSSPLSWTQLQPVEPTRTDFERLGLKEVEEDESMRLQRLPEFDQYTRAVEDFSPRRIGEPSRILEAFQGLQNVFCHPKLVGGEFRFGLPLRFIDAALLWLPQAPMCRREPERDHNGVVTNDCPPTWSWASRQCVKETPSTGVFYERPYDIQADEFGMTMRQLPYEHDKNDGPREERMRPLHRLVYVPYKVSCNGVEMTKLRDVGLLCKLPLSGKNGAMGNLSDWESRQDWASMPSLPPHAPRLDKLTTRHLVLQTQVAPLFLSGEIARARTSLKIGRYVYCRELGEQQPDLMPDGPEAKNIISTSRERRVMDPSAPAGDKTVGFAKLDDAKEPRGTNAEAFEAIVMSEAQYFGNEKRIDVLGYPLYNIMIVKRRSDQVLERLGLGKIYKSAWRRANPKMEVVILE